MKKKFKKEISTFNEIVKKIHEMNYYYNGVDCEYDKYRACENGSDCCQRDYCRCGIIQNARVTNVDINRLIQSLCFSVKEPIIMYCLDRVFRIFEIYEPSSWDIKVGSGYYGEEIDNIKLSSSKEDEIIKIIEELKNCNSNEEKIKKCLEYEYGFVLDELINTNHAEILDINLSEVVLNNKDYSKKLSRSNIDLYKNYELPRAICVNSNGYYRVIDGYNRILSAKKNYHPRKKIKIILLD